MIEEASIKVESSQIGGKAHMNKQCAFISLKLELNRYLALSMAVTIKLFLIISCTYHHHHAVLELSLFRVHIRVHSTIATSQSTSSDFVVGSRDNALDCGEKKEN